MLGKIIRNGHGFEFVEMDQQSLNNCIDRLIEANLVILRKCYAKTGEFAFASGLSELTRNGIFAQVVLAMFDACAVRSFTAMNTELVRQVHLAKNGNGGEG